MAGRRKHRGTAGRKAPRRSPFRKILVATDFAQDAGWAVERAARLPLAEGGKLIIAHVLPYGIPPKYEGQIERDAQRSLEDIVRRVLDGYRKAARADVSVVSVLLTGTTYVEIIRLARTEMADIIVIGKHGRRVIRDLLLGSTAEKIIRTTNIPVLIVKVKPSGSYNRPVIALDLEDTARSTIELALRSLGPKVTNISVVHAYTAPFEGFIVPSFSAREVNAYRNECRDEALSGLQRLLKLTGDTVRWKVSVKRGDPRFVLTRESATHRADLMVLGTHSRSGLSHALLGSVAEYVVRSAACDVLLSPPARFSFALP